MSRQRILGVFFRNLYALRKGPHQLCDLFYWPLVDIILWGLTSSWIQSYADAPTLPLVLLTGLIFWQVTWRGSLDVSVSLLQEFWQRNLVNLCSTPLKLFEWIAGVLLLGFCKLLCTITFGSLAVYILYSLNVFALGWEFLPFAASLLVFGWVLGFLSSSLIIYFGHQVEAFAFMIGFIFAPFSAVFYPLTVLPAWAQKIAWCLPSTYIFEGMRSILATGTFPWSYFWTSLLANAILLTLSLLIFVSSFYKSCQKGLRRFE